MKPYKFIAIAFVLSMFFYIVLNLAWYSSSSFYMPSSKFIDTNTHFEDINKLWTEYRKGHTEKAK